jgi:hypothetical protein
MLDACSTFAPRVFGACSAPVQIKRSAIAEALRRRAAQWGDSRLGACACIASAHRRRWAQPLPRTLRRIRCGQDNSNEYQERAMARYGKKASEKVERAMHEMKRGELRSGSSGKKVKSRKQAVAIGLSEARRAGGKVPKKSKSSSRSS